LDQLHAEGMADQFNMNRWYKDSDFAAGGDTPLHLSSLNSGTHFCEESNDKNIAIFL